MIDIRRIYTQEELDAAKAFIKPPGLEPDWAETFVVMDGSAVIGIFCPTVKLVGNQVLLDIEPLHMTRPCAASFMAMGFVDARMRTIAEWNGLRGYHFAIKNDTPRFQALAEKYLPVTWTQGQDERDYYRIFS